MTEKPKARHVALYARVSTTNGTQDPENQLSHLRKYCAEREGWKVAGEFVDRISGTTKKRPALDQLMAACDAKKIDVVVVWKFDRFARSVVHLRQGIERFQRLGIAFVSTTEGVDTTSPMGRFFTTLLAAFAELELSVIRERVKLSAGLRKEKGVPFGPKRRFRISNEELVRRSKKESVSEIAESLGCTRQLLYSRLRSGRKPRGVVK